MKKIAVVICFIAVGFGVRAQGDTIRGKLPYWHYNFYDSTWCRAQDDHGEDYLFIAKGCVINRYGKPDYWENVPPMMAGRGYATCKYFDESQEVAIRMDMDSAGEIKGLVFGSRTFYDYNSDSGFFYGSFYSNYVPYYIRDTKYGYMCTENSCHYTNDYIFNIYDDMMNLIWSDTLPTADIDVDYYMKIGFNTDSIFLHRGATMDYSEVQYWGSGREATNYIGLCKVDFDTSIQVPQTFYIGITSSTPINTTNDTMCVITALFEWYWFNEPHTNIYSNIPYESRRYRISDNSNVEAIENWAEEECHYGVQTCLYPILSLPCHDVEGLQYEPLGSAGTIAYVQWDGDPLHTRYELSYGPRGTAPGEGTVVQPSTTHWVISPLDRNTHYDVYVRARCDLDTIKWSAWSDPLHVHIASYGIDEAAAPEVTLSPNPTTGKLTVGCEAEIKEVELYDMQGRMVSGKWKEESGKCVVLDLAGLPAGSYILVAHTTKGVATRTVEKR